MGKRRQKPKGSGSKNPPRREPRRSNMKQWERERAHQQQAFNLSPFDDEVLLTPRNQRSQPKTSQQGQKKKRKWWVSSTEEIERIAKDTLGSSRYSCAEEDHELPDQSSE